MSKKVTYTRVEHQWEGIAIVRKDGTFSEVNLGVIGSTKKLEEAGAKKLFTNLPEGTLNVEVKKNADIITVYEMDSDEFIKVAKVVEVPNEVVSEVPVEVVPEAQ